MDKLRKTIAKIIELVRINDTSYMPNDIELKSAILALIAEQGEPPVLSDKEIISILRAAFSVTIPTGSFNAITNAIKAQWDACIAWGLAQKQAGQRDVMDWVEDHQSQDITQVTFDRKSVEPCVLIRNDEWQAYKKSLGM